MKFLTRMVLPVCSFIVILSACKKDDDEPVATEFSKKGQLVNTTQEVPPIVSPSTATGTMDVTYNKTTKLLSYTVNWAGLSDSITGSHIHGTAARGASAGVKVPFTIPNRGALTGSYSGTFTVEGVLVKEDSLLNGFYYLNIHTKKNPAGEIRGQMEFK